MTIVTIFRSRLRVGVADDYAPVARRMSELVQSMDGFLGQSFYVTGEERVTIVRFRDWQSHERWATNPEHLKAQELGRSSFYEFYELSVSEEVKFRSFEAGDISASEG